MGRASRSARPPPSPSDGDAVSAVALFFLGMQAQLQLYHWSTASYSRHRASEELQQRVADAADRLVEAMMATATPPGSRRPPTAAGRPPLQLLDLAAVAGEERAAAEYLSRCERFMTHELPTLLGDDAALLSIRDDALAAVRRARYAFGLS
jgi:hypothetical protein